MSKESDRKAAEAKAAEKAARRARDADAEKQIRKLGRLIGLRRKGGK